MYKTLTEYTHIHKHTQTMVYDRFPNVVDCNIKHIQDI